MKIKPADIDSFARKPGVRFVLFYGPDRGRATLLGETAAKALAQDVRSFHDDITKQTAETVKSAAQAGDSLFGATHCLRLRDVTDKSAGIVEDLIGLADKSVPVIVEAGDLKPASKLRKLFENSKTAAACALYAPDIRDLARLARERLKRENIAADATAIDRLASLLPSDTMSATAEIERFVSWASGKSGVTIADIEDVFSDRADFEASDLALAVGSGNPGLVLRMMQRLGEETSVGLVRQAQWHFQRLLEARAATETGETIETAVSRLKPPVFFKQTAAFQAQIRLWDTRRIERALGRLVEAEQHLKSTGFPENAVAGQCFLEISLMAKGEKA